MMDGMREIKAILAKVEAGTTGAQDAERLAYWFNRLVQSLSDIVDRNCSRDTENETYLDSMASVTYTEAIKLLVDLGMAEEISRTGLTIIARWKV